MRVYVHYMHAGTWKGQKRALHSSELEFQEQHRLSMAVLSL